MVIENRTTAVAGKADIVSSVSASACHIGGPIEVHPGELTLVYGIFLSLLKIPDKILSRFFQSYYSLVSKYLLAEITDCSQRIIQRSLIFGQKAI